MNQAPSNLQRVRIDYYEGAYGHTIRIDVRIIDDLITLKSLFLGLASDNASQLNLLDLSGVTATGLQYLILEQNDSTANLGTGLKSVTTNTGEIGFIWSLPHSGWTRCGGLLQGMIDYGKPCHQYMTDEARDETIVELAFGE
jgi:hypothetical protein